MSNKLYGYQLHKEEMNTIVNRELELLSKDNFFSIIDADGEEWVSPAEAARILNLSVGRIYHIKNYLTHRKGNSSRSRVLFLKRTLFDDYMNM